MKKINITYKNKIVQKLLGLFSLSAVLFVFQACYGTYEDEMIDAQIEGIVTSKTNNTPLNGIRVDLLNTKQYTFTDSNGKFIMYAPYSETFDMRFSDTDGETNGSFRLKNTTLSIDNTLVQINIELQPLK